MRFLGGDAIISKPAYLRVLVEGEVQDLLVGLSMASFCGKRRSTVGMQRLALTKANHLGSVQISGGSLKVAYKGVAHPHTHNSSRIDY